MAREDTSTPEERARLVADALAHAEALDERYRPPETLPSPKWKGPLGSVLLLVAGLLAVRPPAPLVPPARPGVSEDARAIGARTSLALQAAEVEALRSWHQRLPTVDELGPLLPGVRYVRSNDRVYQLVAYGPDRSTLVFDSTEPDEWRTPRLLRMLDAEVEP